VLTACSAATAEAARRLRVRLREPCAAKCSYNFDRHDGVADATVLPPRPECSIVEIYMLRLMLLRESRISSAEAASTDQLSVLERPQGRVFTVTSA